MGLSSSVTPRGAGSSSVTPVGASSLAFARLLRLPVESRLPPLLRLPIESRLPLARLPACFLPPSASGTRVFDSAGCSTGENGVGSYISAERAGLAEGGDASDALSDVPFVVAAAALATALGLSGSGTSREPRLVGPFRDSVGELFALTGKRV